AISLWLFGTLLHVGIAIATAVAAWVNVLLLAFTLARRGLFVLTPAQWRGQAAIAGISLVMGAALFMLAWAGAGHLASGVPLWHQAGVLFILVGFGATAYFTLVHITGIQRLGPLLRRLRRRG